MGVQLGQRAETAGGFFRIRSGVDGFLFLTVAVGFWVARKGSKTSREYFIGDSKLPWYVVGTSMVAPALRMLPIGMPKLLVSTMASGDMAPDVGTADLMTLYPVTDIAGLNRLSRRILANAAHALAGMLLHARPQDDAQDKPAIPPPIMATFVVAVVMAGGR